MVLKDEDSHQVVVEALLEDPRAGEGNLLEGPKDKDIHQVEVAHQ